ncbi:hypothetical protein FHL15_002772 [Xylaria flabelliformis]|uniref:Uncharacterized protein n=1 Tax=Xylaria flabelliformis TaxID=2512241 RepID=A0A553I8H0_9PEZI|nr:hypothetical protein FHL15_002772 [Xylaria flabelliformis]
MEENARSTASIPIAFAIIKSGIYMEKSPIFLGAVGALDGQTGVSLALNEHHTRQRKALGYLFTNSALLQLETLVIVHIHKLVGALQAAATENRAADVSNWYTYAAFDIMGDLCFAEPFGCLDQASGTEWSTSVIQIFVGATWTQGIRRISGVGTWLESIMTQLLIPAKAAGWRKTHLSNAQEKTRRRLADNDRNHADFMHHILLNNESKKSLSETEIFLNMAGFVSGGTDTTATALTGWTYFVCTHPKVLNRLLHEVRTTFAKEDDIRWERVNKLKYLEATLQETLRLYPPSPASQQRIVPPGGATIDGYYIPGGKTVAVAPWVSTHSSLNFYEPDTFQPERWLSENEKFSKDQLNASLPFGTGPRVCMGKNLAYLEMLLITAHLLWNFDLELDLEEYRDRNDVWGLDEDPGSKLDAKIMSVEWAIVDKRWICAFEATLFRVPMRQKLFVFKTIITFRSKERHLWRLRCRDRFESHKYWIPRKEIHSLSEVWESAEAVTA